MRTNPTPPLAVVVALLGLPAVMTAAAAVRVPDPLDVSLQTLPVGFYGSYWGVRPASLVAKMSRMTLLILMQNDGTCWKKCCPLAETDPVSKCGPLNNASALPGCDPSCDQQLTQIQQFAAIKGAAKAGGRRAPHCMMYLNAVYLWPFDASNSQGRAVRTASSWPPPPTPWAVPVLLLLTPWCLSVSAVAGAAAGRVWPAAHGDGRSWAVPVLLLVRTGAQRAASSAASSASSSVARALRRGMPPTRHQRLSN
jgi:hypothetical protein